MEPDSVQWASVPFLASFIISLRRKGGVLFPQPGQDLGAQFMAEGDQLFGVAPGGAAGVVVFVGVPFLTAAFEVIGVALTAGAVLCVWSQPAANQVGKLIFVSQWPNR